MTDADLIDKVGGPSALVALLGLSHQGAVQRVSNWKRRGIPPRIRLEHRELFDSLEKPELIGTEGAPPVPADQVVSDAA